MPAECRLTAVEFDVLWRELGFGEPPYPLDIPSPGISYEERADLVATVRRDLDARGITQGGAPLRELVEALTLLAGSDVLIDGHLVLQDHIRVVATRGGELAVMVLQLRDDVAVRAFDGPRLGAALAELMPQTPPANGQSVSLPYAALADALRGLGNGDSAWEFERALRRAGVRGQDVRWLAGLALGSQSAGAQFGVTARHGAEPRRGMVSWYATPEGGVIVHRHQGSEWVTIAPGDPARLVSRVEDLAGAR